MKRTVKIALCIILVLGISSISASCDKEEELDQITYIDGYVYNAETESPLGGVTVYLDNESFVTSNDGRYFFTQLEPGKNYTLSCRLELYQSYSKEVLAVYPSTNINIHMELMGRDNPKPSPIKNIRIEHLESFDFLVEHGVSENMITIVEEGSYLAPDSYQFKLSTSYQKEMPAGGSASGEEPKGKPAQYCIQLGDKQWIDYGEGYYLNTERKHIGFEDVFQGIDYAVGRVNQALEVSTYVRDLGDYEVGGRKTRRLKTLTIVPETVTVDGEEVEQKVLIELNVSICTEEGALKDVPIDVSVSVFESVRIIKTFTHFRLSNINILFAIDAPDEGESAVIMPNN